ncbi:EAL domain-containing protein [Rhodanobacter sp. AS-Z3]|uniref:putative bifunctional diguanylate cyclase/phosphodiesterase n=1 Tax=Rhodanobacter sp. AS-Z3 TaxID=3031330 RepID=UPI0024793AC1|nr:EAL domain-containing protein [Rhodanobacter sp. AS-Z3]WEN14212.1 EAL domain-containing protein [Rhodanobacter sp. AS-Z3]
MTLFVSSQLIACGICLFAGFYSLLARSAGQRDPMVLAFGNLCLLLAAYLLLTASIAQTNSLNLACSLVRWQVAIACLIFPAATWFIGHYAQLQRRRPWLGVACAIFGGLFFVNLFSPSSVIYSAIAKGAPIVLPWGETVSNFVGQKSSLFGVYYLARDAAYLWAIGCCIALWRRNSTRARPLTLYLLIQAVAAIHGEVISRAELRSVSYESLIFLALVVLMGDQLRRELQHRATLLTRNLDELRSETLRREQVESNLRHLAYHDTVTGLPNRLAVREHVQTALMAKNPAGSALIMLDLDHFRTINEALGHDVGDKLLKAVATRLVSAVPSGSLVARPGGDEFALHLKLPVGLAPAGAALDIAGDLTKQLTAPFRIGAHDLAIGVSGGIALLPGMAGDVDSALRQVAMALHKAKATGRNRTIVFEQAMQAQADRRLLLEKGLRLALERDEFELHYQPQIDASGQFVAAEALLRWCHPIEGMISPEEFIPIAEEAGLIHAIGRYVMQRACVEREGWPTAHATARVSINVSPWQLFAQDFVTSLQEIVNATRTLPRQVTIEITESALLHDLDDLTRKIDELANCGFHFALDDFGSGYASLGHLKKLPLHELKIDRAFIENLQAGVTDPFVNAIITIAHEQKLLVVAEGVETEPQRVALVEMGCDAAQGHLISQPLRADSFCHWLEQQPARQVLANG